MVKKFLADAVILLNNISGSGLLHDKFSYNAVMVYVFSKCHTYCLRAVSISILEISISFGQDTMIHEIFRCLVYAAEFIHIHLVSWKNEIIQY